MDFLFAWFNEMAALNAPKRAGAVFPLLVLYFSFLVPPKKVFFGKNKNNRLDGAISAAFRFVLLFIPTFVFIVNGLCFHFISVL